MSRNRKILVILGLLIVVASIALVVYSLTPTETLSEQLRLSPTLFVPPGGRP